MHGAIFPFPKVPCTLLPQPYTLAFNVRCVACGVWPFVLSAGAMHVLADSVVYMEGHTTFYGNRNELEGTNRREDITNVPATVKIGFL